MADISKLYSRMNKMPAKTKVLLTILPLFWPKMPPLGLAYLQNYLIDKGIPADILDLNNDYYNLAEEKLKASWLISCNTLLEKNIISIIKQNYPAEFNAGVNRMLQYDIVGFSCFKSNINSTFQIIRLLKTQKSSIRIILGGPEITRQFFKTKGEFNKELLDLTDLIVVGEGERGLYDFITRKNDIKTVLKFFQLRNLNHLPYPKFLDINLDSYPKNSTIALQFSRGCIRKCNFCSERLLHKGFRVRPVKNTIDEIRYHLNRNKTKYFIFFDSVLNGDIKKLEGLCDAIIANFGSINWEAQIAIRNDMPEGIFEKMKNSGCYNLFIGMESGSDNTLRRMNKGYNAKQARDFFKKLNNAGLCFGVSIIVGYPGETNEDFKESLDFLIQNKELIPKIEQINPFTYYSGTNVDECGDYKLNTDSLKRMRILIKQIKKNNFKYTNAFLGNLIEKSYDQENRTRIGN